MAKNGAFIPAAAKVHPQWRTPINAIFFQGACAALMTMVNFGSLILYIGYLLNFFAVLAVLSLFRFRGREGWRKMSVVSFAWPLVPLVFVLPGIWMIIYGVRLEPVISAAAAVTLGSGALFYHLRLRDGQASRDNAA
jgi:basic amino acid/polyamine antiporter, APA family